MVMAMVLRRMDREQMLPAMITSPLRSHGEDEGQRRGGGEGDDGHSLPDFKREGQITVEEERQHG